MPGGMGVDGAELMMFHNERKYRPINTNLQ